MFNLETAITEWRRQMLAAGIQTPVPLEELETHLRESFEQEQKAGRNAPEAFEFAVQKIGGAGVIQGEFKKIGVKNDKNDWKLMEISFVIGAGLFPLCLCGNMLWLKAGTFGGLTPGERASAMSAVVLYALLAWSGRLGYRLFPVVPSKRSRDIITVFCVLPVALWWIVFMNFIAPRHDFTMGQFGVAFLWAFITPAGIMIGLPWGIETAARKNIARLAT